MLLPILLFSCQSDDKKGEEHTTQVEENSTAPEATKTPKTAIIKGVMTYPNGPFPKDLSVVIRDVNTGNIYSSRKWSKETGEYSVDVAAPATYEIYALTGLHQGYKAYYSEYVTCGMRDGCPSHQRILVPVKAGETVNNINPQDWYIP